MLPSVATDIIGCFRFNLNIREDDMAKTIRIATFNCENLFRRPKIFAARGKRPNMLLGKVAELRDELAKKTFDQAKIKQLKKDLQGYAKVNDIRGKHTSKKIGARDWLGWVELTRKPANDIAVKNTARVIADLNADIVCLVEVENRPLLQQFHDNILYKLYLKKQNKKGYKYIRLVDGNDDRGIDVAIMSRLPLNWIKSHIHETTSYNGKTVNLYSRDCLEVDVQATDKHPIRFFINHFKSMGYSPPNDTKSDRRRLGQAKGVVNLASNLNLEKDFVVVAGDLNSEPASPSLEPLVSHKKLYNVNLKLPAAERGTYRTGNKQLDYLIISNALEKKLKDVHIERRGLFSNKWKTYSSVKSRRTEASDHAGVVATFII
jgi:endonuclease/exonuclease/phosphatase family metal-dependent hydrolase